MLPALELTEYATTAGVQLGSSEKDYLLDRALEISVAPSKGLTEHYDLTPSLVGVINLGTRMVQIRPRFGIRNALFLISYSLDPSVWKLYQHHLADDATFVEAIAEIFVLHLRKALARGVLQGYRYEEAALTTVRGRIRIGDQIRQRYGRLLPIEVAFDEFTEDTTENQLLKAALVRLGRMPLRSHAIRRSLREFETVLENVSAVQFDRRRLPTVHFTRLNERYRSSIALASFILRSLGVEFRDGSATTGAFLVDMADVFEDFLVVAFREHLRVTSAELPQGGKGKGLWLDHECGVHLKPDISLWHRSACRLVADVKYKISDGGANPADIYQLLAYTVAANVRNGILIHAAGTGSVHRTRHGDKRLEVVAMDLSQDPKGILQQVASLARTLTNRAKDAVQGPGNLPEPRNLGVYS